MKKISLQELKYAAQQDDEASQYALGMNYYAGIETPQDFTEAARWFERAAAQGNVEATFLLATQFANGLGVPVILERACELLESIQGSHADANYALSKILRNKDYSGHNAEVACYLVKHSAERGHCDSMYELACMYRDGTGIERDVKAAEHWYAKAKAQGHVSSVIELLYP